MEKIKYYIVTADVVNSRKYFDPAILLQTIKAVLNVQVQDYNYDIYRGDEIQARVHSLELAFELIIALKASIRALDKRLNIRAAIGVGEESYRADTVSESSGPAYYRSGALLNELKKKNQSIMISTEDNEIKAQINLIFKLLTRVIDQWTPSEAEAVSARLSYPDKTQTELGEMLGIKQNTMSNRMKRSQYELISEVSSYIKTLEL